MHGATLALTQAALPAENFKHHGIDVAALGDGMAVAAMRAGNIVDLLLQLLADADGARLLPGIKMNEARDLAIAEFDMKPLLELTDRLHLAVGLQQFFPAEL